MRGWAALCRAAMSIAALTVALSSVAFGQDPPAVEVVVEGIEDELRENVLANLGLWQRKDHPGLTEIQIRQLHARAPEEIRRALEPLGYYQPRVEPALERTETGWRAHYRIDPGSPLPVKTIDIELVGEGKTDPLLRRRIEDFPLSPGDRLHHGRYETGKRQLQKTATERGYFDARFDTARVRVDLRAYEARILLRLDTGPRYRFGEVTFTDGGLKESLLQRFVPFGPGDPYDYDRLIELQRDLIDSEYFKQVDVEPRVGQAHNRRVPIDVRLEPRLKQEIKLGVGFGTDTGPRLSAGLERRRANRRGHRYRADAQTSDLSDSVSFRYTVPLKDPRRDALTYSAGWSRERPETSTSEIWQLGVNHTRKRGDWQRTRYLNFRNEQFEVADETGTSTLLTPGMTWTLIRADDRRYPDRGYRVILDLRGAHDAVVSDTSFLQAHLDAKWIRRVGPGRVLLRGELGTSVLDEFDQLPPSVRFFAGGDRSVRGYDYEALGPTDADGDVIGGRHLVVASAEYEFPVRDKWGVAVFYDAGNALDEFGDSLAEGAGIGLRWRSPIGPVRVDLASALSRPGNPIKLHVVIGPDL